MEEASGSIPLSSTVWGFLRTLETVGLVLGGVVAGEGCFTSSTRAERFGDGSPRRRFRFVTEMSVVDRILVEALQQVLGCGVLAEVGARRPTWQPTCRLEVSREADLLGSVVPFADRFLLAPSLKARQYAAWRQELVAYVASRPSQWGRGPSPCSRPACDGPVRGQGLCRRHYYEVTGH